MINNNSNRRVEWLDISKFIAITIMCLGHIGLPKSISALIHIFHMPVFFIVSGICYNEEKYSRFAVFLWQKVKTLLIPSYFWCFIMYFIWRIYCLFEMRGEAVSLLEFVVLAFTKDAATSMFGNLGVIQWFFTSLFFAELFFWCIVTLVKKLTKKYKFQLLFGVIIILIIVNYLYSTYIGTNPLGVGTSIIGAVFIIIGYCFKGISKNWLSWTCRKNIISFILASVFLVISWILNGSTSMRILQYNNIVLFLIGACAGSYLVFQVARFVEAYMSKLKWLYNWILYIGRNTLIVLVFNRLVQFTLIRLINYLIRMINFSWESTIGLMIMVFIDLVIEMLAFTPIIYIINKYIPFSVGKDWVRDIKDF